MAGTLKKVRIVLACAYGDVGHELTPNGTLRDWLVGNGFAVVVEDAPRSVPSRPAQLAGKAAKKVAVVAKQLFGG